MQPGMTPMTSVDTTSTPGTPAITIAPAPSIIAPAGNPSDHELVPALQAELRAILGDKRYALWIENKVGLSTCDDTLTVAVGSPFLLSWMQRQFKDAMSDAARSILGNSARVAFAVDASLALGRQDGAPEALPVAATVPTLPIRTQAAASHSPGETLLLPRSAAELQRAIVGAVDQNDAVVGNLPGSATRSAAPAAGASFPSRGRRLADLRDFVAGPQSELALAAARQVAAGQATMFNPLYLHGPVGSGKTHLLEGICRDLKRTRPGANVVLLTSESFGNYFTQALRDRSLPSFRQRFRSVDALLVDNVEFFESKRVFQEEFLHTFIELADHGRQIVLTGSRHPRLLNRLGDELATRFLSGLVCRLDTPDLATRQAIVDAKAARLPADISPEALQYVAHRFQNNVRELEGALNCLQTYHAMTSKRVTLSAARQVLADLERDCLRIIRLADIERVICSVFGVKATDLQSESRARSVSQPRMLAMFLARKHTQSAYTEIGQHFGGRNHSTVMSAERKVQQWLDENSKIQVASQTWTIGEILSSIEQQLLAG